MKQILYAFLFFTIVSCSVKKDLGYAFGIVTNAPSFSDKSEIGTIELLDSSKKGTHKTCTFHSKNVVDAILHDSVKFKVVDICGILIAEEVTLDNLEYFKERRDLSEKLLFEHNQFIHKYAPEHRRGHINKIDTRNFETIRNRKYAEAEYTNTDDENPTPEPIYLPVIFDGYHNLNPEVIDSASIYYLSFVKKKDKVNDQKFAGKKIINQIFISHPNDSHGK